DRVGERGSKPPGGVFLSARQQSCECRNKSRAKRASRNEQEKRLGDAVRRSKCIQFGGCTKCACNQDTACQTGELPKKKGEHYCPRGASNLTVRIESGH